MDQTPKSPNLRTLKNGAVYDMDKKRIVSSKDVTTKISASNAVDYLSRRMEKKREVARAAANQAIDRSDFRVYDDLAYIAAITDTAMIKATTADDPKAIEAARFIIQITGMEEAAAQSAAAQDSAGAGVAGDLVQLLRDVLHDRGIIIDVDQAQP